MIFKKEFTPSVQVDFLAKRFYEIPFLFFAEWLNLTLEISSIIQPGFVIEIPKKQLDWYNFPDREVFGAEGTYVLRASSALLKNGENTIHVLAQYGYETIPGQYIIVKSNAGGGILSRNNMNNSAVNFEIEMEEKHLHAVEEVFYIFQ